MDELKNVRLDEIPTHLASGPNCRSIDGQIACGYACKSDGLRVRCAQTPQGRCQVLDGQVVCFDPPAYVIRAYEGSLPEPECKAGEGEGYTVNHSTMTYLMNPKGRFACVIPYSESPQQIAAQIRAAMAKGPHADSC